MKKAARELQAASTELTVAAKSGDLGISFNHIPGDSLRR